MQVTHVPSPGIVTVTDTYLGSGSPPLVVGGAGTWNDGSDATYAELEVFEHPDVSYADSGTVTLGKVATTQNPALATAYAMIRYQALDPDMRKPHARVDRVGAIPDETNPLISTGLQPWATGTGAPEWYKLPLVEWYGGGMADVLAEIQPGSSAQLVLNVIPEYLSTIAYRTPRMRIYEAYLVIETPGSDAPPCRIYPRSDGLGVGAGRAYPPPKSQQRSPGNRGVGYY